MEKLMYKTGLKHYEIQRRHINSEIHSHFKRRSKHAFKNAFLLNITYCLILLNIIISVCRNYVLTISVNWLYVIIKFYLSQF